MGGQVRRECRVALTRIKAPRKLRDLVLEKVSKICTHIKEVKHSHHVLREIPQLDIICYQIKALVGYIWPTTQDDLF